MKRGRPVVPGSRDHRAMLLNNEASRLCRQGLFERAEPLFLEALRIWEVHFGPRSDPVAVCCQSLGVLYTALGDFDGAILQLRRALDILSTLPGSDADERGAYQGILDTLEYGSRLELSAAQSVARGMWG